MARDSGVETARVDLKDIVRKQGRVAAKLSPKMDSKILDMLKNINGNLGTRGMPSDVDVSKLPADFMDTCKKLTDLLRRLFDRDGDNVLSAAEIARMQDVLNTLRDLGLLQDNAAAQLAASWKAHVSQLTITYWRSDDERQQYMEGMIRGDMARDVEGSTQVHRRSFNSIMGIASVSGEMVAAVLGLAEFVRSAADTDANRLKYDAIFNQFKSSSENVPGAAFPDNTLSGSRDESSASWGFMKAYASALAVKDLANALAKVKPTRNTSTNTPRPPPPVRP
eukprot:jgi/Tetstr1/454023/TSEL_040942.t1